MNCFDLQVLKQLADVMEMCMWHLCWKNIQDTVSEMVRSIIGCNPQPSILEGVNGVCEEYRKRVTEIESSLNSNDYISHNLLKYFETVVINVIDCVCRLFHPNEPLPDSMRIV